jgi:hypothetical protein
MSFVFPLVPDPQSSSRHKNVERINGARVMVVLD